MDLVKELDLENFTEEEKNQVLAKFTDSLLKRLLLRVYSQLNEADQKTLDGLNSAGSPEKLEEFLSAKVPDLDQLRDEETRGLVEEMKAFVAETKS